jgi:DMSO/TMAO reductase YedYZ molybdopterin-dependent catalytic subunit
MTTDTSTGTTPGTTGTSTGTADLESISAPSIPPAAPGEAISLEELGLAARNHAMPAEAMRWDVTPPGLHYVLVHYDIPETDAATWTVRIGGAVERELELSLADLAEREQHTLRVTLECAGNGRVAVEPRPISQPWLTGAVGTADWSGVRLAELLAEAGVTAEGVDVVFTGADHGVDHAVEQDYERGLSVQDALEGDVLVATAMNGQPLPPQHGHPVRLVVPGWYGMASVKWLREIRVIDHEYDGYQNAVAYRLQTHAEDEGIPVTRIEPRAMLVPPGFPDFLSRTRVVEAGPTELRGRAWSGWAPVARVEVSTDDGSTWTDAELGPDHGRYAWRAFTATWDARPGVAQLRVRATDETGRTQSPEPVQTLGGFTNNADPGLRVLVR